MMYAIGIMSGTSMDGIDTVLVDIDGFGMETKMKVIGYHEYPMPIDMKEKIKKACDEKNDIAFLTCTICIFNIFTISCSFSISKICTVRLFSCCVLLDWIWLTVSLDN